MTPLNVPTNPKPMRTRQTFDFAERGAATGVGAGTDGLGCGVTSMRGCSSGLGGAARGGSALFARGGSALFARADGGCCRGFVSSSGSHEKVMLEG